MKRYRRDHNIDADPPSQSAPSHHSLTDRISALVVNLPPDNVTLAEIREMLGHDGLLLFVAFLSIIFLIPVSLPGVSTAFGAAILLIGISRLLNRTLWIPNCFLKRQLPSDRLCNCLTGGLKWVNRLEGISRSRRLEWLISGRFVNGLNNFALILGAVLLMAPFGLVPLSNTLPALAILLFAIGLLRRDGVCICLGHVVNVATIIYFSLLLGGGGLAIYELFRKLA